MFPTFSSHNELCNQLNRDGMLRSPLALDAFRRCDRKYFTPHKDCYMYSPQVISVPSPTAPYTVTISSPTVHAPAADRCAEVLLKTVKDANNQDYVPQRRVCDVASGSGYMCAVFGKMLQSLRDNTTNPTQRAAHQHSKVIGVEILQNLVHQSLDNLKHCDPTLITEGLVEVHRMDAFRNRLPEAPFDIIHTGVCIQFVPLALMSQLKIGGKLILVLQVNQHNDQKFYEVIRKQVSPQDLAQTPFAALTDDDKLFNYALQLQESGQHEQINAFVATFFTYNFLFDCNYILAHSDSTAPQQLEIQKVKH